MAHEETVTIRFLARLDQEAKYSHWSEDQKQTMRQVREWYLKELEGSGAATIDGDGLVTFRSVSPP